MAGMEQGCLACESSLIARQKTRLKRLNKLEKNLRRKDLKTEYYKFIWSQIVEGIVQKAPIKASGQQFHIPYKLVARKATTSTKLPTVYLRLCGQLQLLNPLINVLSWTLCLIDYEML